MISIRIKSRRGGVLLVSLVFVLVFAAAAASVLTLALNSYQLTMRNEARAEARAVAESELEALFYQFRDLTIVQRKVPSDVPEYMGNTGTVSWASQPDDHHNDPLNPFLQANRLAGWRVWRSMKMTTNPVTGWIPVDQTSTYGTTTTIDVKIEVKPPLTSAFADTLVIRIGRQFSVAKYSIFQHAVFYQGDLDLYAGGNVTIAGDLVANGNIYMSSLPSTQLVLEGKVSYLAGNYFNTDSSGSLDYTKPGLLQADGTSLPAVLNTAPIFDPNPVWDTSSGRDVSSLATNPTGGDEAAAQTSQLQTMQNPENLLGGANASVIQLNNPTLFPDVNSVYRAAIVPPPDAPAVIAAGGGGEYTSAQVGVADDPTISAQRMYNQAGLRIEIDAGGNVIMSAPTDPTNLQSTYTTLSTSSYAALYAAVVKATIPASGSTPATTTAIVPMFDARENQNVAVTTIDVSLLNQGLSSAGMLSSFNGVVYIWLVNGNSSQPSGIRLINGSTLPMPGPNQANGFSVATNGGIYVQGDYNTTVLPSGAVAADGTVVGGATNPAMLMGDSMTLLSGGWTYDAANATYPNANALLSSNNRNAQPGGSANPTQTIQTVNAGLLTGNTSTSTDSYNGGVQNLVRYLENWKGDSVVFNGSLGRLFDSKMFTAPFVSPWGSASDDATKDVYHLPNNRTFNFERAMDTMPPPGSPQFTSTSRGRYYFWGPTP